MNAAQERQAPAKRDEESMKQCDAELRFLNLQVSKIEAMIRSALEAVNTLDVSPLDTTHED